MSFLRLITVSLLYHWRTNLAVACGVAAGTAVLTGALLVGDSMRGSLRDLTLDRLGRIDEVLLADRFFRARLAEELASSGEFKTHFDQAVPAIMLRASLAGTDPEAPCRANRVNVLGCDERFWRLGSGGPSRPPGKREIVLNRPLADLLGVGVGQAVLVRLPRLGTIPADSPLGRKHETVRSLRLRVSAVILAKGLGRFGLRSSQQLPRNAYVSLDWLAERLGQPRHVNAILVSGKTASAVPSLESAGVLQCLLRPSLADYGIRIERTPEGYFNISSDRMLLEPAAEKAIMSQLAGPPIPSGEALPIQSEIQPALTYLANTIACGEREIPYSTITAVDFTDRPPLGPFLTPEGKPISTPTADQIVLNTWAADQLGARPGDTIRVTYFEPESSHGQLRQQTSEFRLAAVCRLGGPADDPRFTPQVAGVTDELSMADWDPPFPFDAKRIRTEDEQYWDDHRATPKAFVSLAAGRQLWASRFGRTTSIRLAPAEGLTVADLEKKLTLDPAAQGFVFQPVKRQGLAASVGMTSFNLLFLGFSFFIIAAAVMLVALMFGLGIDQRASQVGILLAVGLRRRQIARLFACEGLVIAAAGSLLGLAAAVGYAALMLLGLRTWWLAAVVTPFLRLHAGGASLAIGYASGVVVAFAAVVWSVRRVGRVVPRRLLANQAAEENVPADTRPKYARKLALGLLVAAVVCGLAAARIGEEIQAGAFFGVGAMVLVAVLALAGEKKGGCSDTLATILLIAALAVIVGVVIQIGGLPWEAF